MKEKIKECLLHLQDLPDIKAKLAEGGNEEVFTETLNAVALELTETFDANLIGELAKGNPVDLRVEDSEEFQKCQDEATKFYGEWNENAVRLAIASFTESGKELNLYVNGEANLTYGELFGLDSEDELATVEAKLTAKQRDGLSGKAFCGPNRSFPVHDKAHAVAALRLINRYKGPGDKDAIRACIVKKAAKFGVGPKKGESAEVDFYPILVESSEELVPLFVYASETDTCEDFKLMGAGELTDEQKTIVETFNTAAEKWMETANSAEFFTNSALFEETEVLPLLLKEDFLFSYFKAKETADSGERNYLLQLVGLTRKLNVSKKELAEAAEPYNIFGNTVLESLLSKLPAEKAVEAVEVTPEATESKEVESAEKIENPVQPVVTPPKAANSGPAREQWVDLLCSPKSKRTEGTKRTPKGKGSL